jgi:glycine/D-amino acid oxidase-like deaminating enzyme
MRVAVVGASLAGLAAGAFLARRGCQVTVFEEASHPEWLDDSPTLAGINHVPGDHLLWGWRSSRPIIRLFGTLKDRPGATARHLLHPVPTGLQVLGHPHRLDWGDRLAEEIGREFPSALESWSACTEAWDSEAEELRQVGTVYPILKTSEQTADGRPEAQANEASPIDSPQDTTADSDFASGAVGALPAEVRPYLDGVTQAVCWRPLEEVSLPAGLWAMQMLAREVAVLKEGVDALARWLAGRLEAAGGSLRLETRVATLKVRGGQVRGISIKEGWRRTTQPAEWVVVAGDKASQLMGRRLAPAHRRRTVGTLVTCLLAVEEEVVPEPLAPLAAYCPAPGEPIFLISQNPESHHIINETSRRVLTVGWRSGARGAEALTDPEELPKRLEKLMPFLPGRWDLVPQDKATGSPLMRWPITETDRRDMTPPSPVSGLVTVDHHPLPGMETTASLTLGVEAAEAILRKL